MKIFLIIPAYNEQNRISDTLKFYTYEFAKKNKELRILVVSESTDSTNAIIRKESRKNNKINLIYSKRKLGKGGAIIKGFSKALAQSSASDLIGFTDADNAVYASEALRMVDYMEAHPKTCGIIASRYIKGSKIIGKIPPSRFISSRAYNLLARALFGLRYSDTQCGCKIFRSDELKKIFPTLSIVDMSFDINLLYSAKLMGIKVKEFPITYHQVNEGTKLKLSRQIPQMLVATIGFRVSRSRFNAIIPDALKARIYEMVKHW